MAADQELETHSPSSNTSLDSFVMASIPSSDTVRVAVTQMEPEWLDLPKAVEKTCRLIEEAAQNGAQLVAFPECWIPGYPAWIWSRSVDFALHSLYLKNSLKRQSPEMDCIRACAAKAGITVALGFSENDHNSLYISQNIIGSDGEIKMHRRKFKPTHMERTIFGDASGDSLNNVVDTDFGRLGALSCWEHIQPLLKYHTFLQREAIHVAGWPPVFDDDSCKGLWSLGKEGTKTIARTYAIESQTFVMHTTSLISQRGIDLMNTHNGMVLNTPGGGSSVIYGPDGRKLSEDLPETEEGIIYADLDMDEILRAKSFVDTCGHYSRPDMLFLGVDDREKLHRRTYD